MAYPWTFRKQRYLLPACAYHKIREQFTVSAINNKENFVGFEEEDL